MGLSNLVLGVMHQRLLRQALIVLRHNDQLIVSNLQHGWF